jgi:hypothetical protein
MLHLRQKKSICIFLSFAALPYADIFSYVEYTCNITLPSKN